MTCQNCDYWTKFSHRMVTVGQKWSKLIKIFTIGQNWSRLSQLSQSQLSQSQLSQSQLSQSQLVQLVTIVTFVWPYLDKFKQVGSSLNKFGQVWTLLDTFEQVGTSLDKFEQVWTSLNKFGQVWTSLLTKTCHFCWKLGSGHRKRKWSRHQKASPRSAFEDLADKNPVNPTQVCREIRYPVGCMKS